MLCLKRKPESKKRILFRIPALILCMTLSLSDAAYAGAPAASVLPSKEPALGVSTDLGSVEESHQASAKTIIYIRDAHDSLEAQENIAAMISHLVKTKGVRTVFEEGFEGPVQSDHYFSTVEDVKVRERVSYYLMERLRIGGAEYAHINRDQDFELVGADDFRLHSENIEWFRLASEHGERVMNDLEALRTEIRVLGDKNFVPEIRQWMRLKTRRDEGSLSYPDYLERLKEIAPEIFKTIASTVPFDSRFPNLSRLYKASAETAAVFKESDIDIRALYDETSRLEDEIKVMFLKDALSRDLFRCGEGLDLLVRVLRFELSPMEFEVLHKRLAEFTTPDFARLIVGYRGKSFAASTRWEENVRSAVKFYETARLRDGVIEKKIAEFAAKPGEETAVLVYGGFHSGAVREILRKHGLSYHIVTPRIRSIDPAQREQYRRLMLAGYEGRFQVPGHVRTAARAPSDFAAAKVSPQAESRFVLDLDRMERAVSTLSVGKAPGEEISGWEIDQALASLPGFRSTFRTPGPESLRGDEPLGARSEIRSGDDPASAPGGAAGQSPLPYQQIDYEYETSRRIRRVTLDNIEHPGEKIVLENISFMGADNEFDFVQHGGPTGEAIGVHFEFHGDHVKLRNIDVNVPAMRHYGIAKSIAQWVLTEAVNRYPGQPNPLVLHLVQNPLIFRVAEYLFEPGTLEVYYLNDDSWHLLSDPATDIHDWFGPITIFDEGPHEDKTITVKKQTDGHFSAEAPEGVTVTMDGYKLTARDAVSGERLDRLAFRKISFDIRGAARVLAETKPENRLPGPESLGDTDPGVRSELRETAEEKPLAVFVGAYPVALAQRIKERAAAMWRITGPSIHLGEGPWGPTEIELISPEKVLERLRQEEGDRQVVVLYDQAHPFEAIRLVAALQEAGVTTRPLAYPGSLIRASVWDENVELNFGPIIDMTFGTVRSEMRPDFNKSGTSGHSGTGRSEMRPPPEGSEDSRMKRARQVFRSRSFLIGFAGSALIVSAAIYFSLPKSKPEHPAAPSEAVIERRQFAAIRGIHVSDTTRDVFAQSAELIDAIAEGVDASDRLRRSQVRQFRLEPSAPGEITFVVEPQEGASVDPAFENVRIRRLPDGKPAPTDLQNVRVSISGGRIAAVREVSEWLAWLPLAAIGLIAVIVYALLKSMRRTETGSIFAAHEEAKQRKADQKIIRERGEERRREREEGEGRSDLRAKDGGQAESENPWEAAGAAEHYASFAENEGYTAANRRLLAFSGLNAGASALDLGSGTGSGTKLILEKVGPEGHVYGIDSAAGMTEYARKAVTEDNVEFRVGEAANLNTLVPEPVSAVLSFNAVHLMNPEELFQEVHAKLGLGGIFAFNSTFYSEAQPEDEGVYFEFAKHILTIISERYDKSLIGRRKKIRFPEIKDYMEAARKAGFTDKDIWTERITYALPLESIESFFMIPGISETLINSGIPEEGRKEVLREAVVRLRSQGFTHLRRSWFYFAAVKQENLSALPDTEEVRRDEPTGVRPELRASAAVAASLEVPFEDMLLPAGVLLNAGEISRLDEESSEAYFDELLVLIEKHRAFDIYIGDPEEVPLSDIPLARFQKLLQEHPERVHALSHSRAHLNKKAILIQVSFFESTQTAGETADYLGRLKKELGVEEILPLDYERAGTLSAFLTLAESFTPGALIKEVSEAFAVRGPNGRWRLAADYVASIWIQVQADYAVQWSA